MYEIIKKRNRYNYDLSYIINCDETPITLDNPCTFILAKKGEKIINIHNNGKEKNRISCILTIAANGNKLIPFIVFKGEKKLKIKKWFIKFTWY